MCLYLCHKCSQVHHSFVSQTEKGSLTMHSTSSIMYLPNLLIHWELRCWMPPCIYVCIWDPEQHYISGSLEILKNHKMKSKVHVFRKSLLEWKGECTYHQQGKLMTSEMSLGNAKNEIATELDSNANTSLHAERNFLHKVQRAKLKISLKPPLAHGTTNLLLQVNKVCLPKEESVTNCNDIHHP